MTTRETPKIESNLSATSWRQLHDTLISNQTPRNHAHFLRATAAVQNREAEWRIGCSGGDPDLLLLGDLLLELARLLPQRLHLFPAPLSLSLSHGHARAQAGSRRGPWRRRYPDGRRHRHQHAAVPNNHGRPSFVASSITDTSRTRHSRPMKAQPVLTSRTSGPISPDEWPHESRLRSAPQQASNGQGDFFQNSPSCQAANHLQCRHRLTLAHTRES